MERLVRLRESSICQLAVQKRASRDKYIILYSFSKHKFNLNLTESDRRRIYEWKLYYECDHAGQPRDRRNPDLSPSKKRKMKKSIKVGCNAKIEIYKNLGSDKVFVEHHWKHNNHGKFFKSVLLLFSLTLQF